MTQPELLALLQSVTILEPASAHACVEAGLLAFLLSGGYTAIVEAYLTVCPESVSAECLAEIAALAEEGLAGGQG